MPRYIHDIDIRRGNQEGTIQRHYQDWVHKTWDGDQHRDISNTGYTRHRTETNTETLATLGTQDMGRRPTQRH
jgi:hypothetical protein